MHGIKDDAVPLTNEWSRVEVDGSHRILRPDTPLPWANYMQSRDGLFYLAIDQRGRGRLQFAHGENLVSTGRNVVVDDGRGTPWSAVAGVAPAEAEAYECIQEPGRTTFVTSRDGIEVTTRVVVDPDAYRDLTQIIVKNTSDDARRVALTAVHRVALKGHDNNNQLDHTEYRPETGALLARRYHFETAPHRYAAFWVGDRAPDSWCGSEQDFSGGDVLAGHEAGWRMEPLPERGVSSTPPLFAFRYALELDPGQEIPIHLVLGIEDTIEDAAEQAATAAESPASIMHRAQEFYADLLQGSEISTPEAAFDVHANRWTRLQLTHQAVTGRRGVDHNWRNNLQDAMGYLAYDPSVLRTRLLEVCALAEPDGFMRRSSPKLQSPDARLKHLQTQRHNDIATWAGLATAKYLQETGDFSLLEEAPAGQSVLDAIDGGLTWTLDNTGAHGLVLFLDGDWSDPLEAAGREGKGESVWTSFAVVHAIQQLLRHLGEDERATRLRQRADDMKDAINRHTWDGEWYIRGFTDAGTPFCTSDEDGGRIAMLMQAWAILSGVASPERARTALTAVEKRCLTPYGPVLYDPPFLYERADLGRESAKRPGTAENGSCYTHGAMMLASAAVTADRPDLAWNIMRTVLPLREEDVYATRAGSPLWWSNYYQSPYGAAPGRSSNHISSGAPAWFLMNLSEGLLGIRPSVEGLRIQPALPAGWDHASMRRRWRGSEYSISIRRTGTASITLDGDPVADAVITPAEDAQAHVVDVEIA